jgi:predicted anti-sigma-YlaC factor YlaD
MKDAVTLDCAAALRLLAAYVDGELAQLDERSVQEHLQRCHSCYSRADFERGLKARLAELSHSKVKPALESRIRTLLSDYPNA